MLKAVEIKNEDAFCMAFIPAVDKEKCQGCEDCIEACSVGVFAMQESKAVPVNAEECLGCESCVEVCKENAITVEETLDALSEQASFLLRDILD